MHNPDKSLRSFRFCTLAGCADVRLEGSQIVGQWRNELVEYYGPPSRRLIEDFLNWPGNPEAILKFTHKFGPLRASPTPGAEFREHLSNFAYAQDHMRNLWIRLSKFPDWQPEGGSLAFRKGFLTYTAPSLYMFLYVDLVTCPANRARKCKREDCPHPYFLAGHLKQTFCSEICAQWGQRKWKQEWWKEHGKKWRAARRSQNRTGGKHGARKTR